MRRFFIQPQYFFHGFHRYGFGRNKGSVGRKWFGYDSFHRRLNLWPVAIWLLPLKKINE